jgi:hypothetical protein
VLPSLQYFDRAFPEITSKYGFKCSFNPTFPPGSQKKRGPILDAQADVPNPIEAKGVSNDVDSLQANDGLREQTHFLAGSP